MPTRKVYPCTEREHKRRRNLAQVIRELRGKPERRVAQIICAIMGDWARHPSEDAMISAVAERLTGNQALDKEILRAVRIMWLLKSRVRTN